MASKRIAERSALIVAVMLVADAAAGSAEAQSTPCYDIALGPWSVIEGTGMAGGRASPPPAEDGSYGRSFIYSVPPRIALTEDSVRSGRSIEIPEGALPTPHRQRVWRNVGDSLFLMFSTGYSGTQATVGFVEGGLAGTLRMFTDAGGSLLYQRNIALAAVDCASPPPVLASTDPALPRSVVLQSGDVLELGTSPPNGLTLEPGPTGQLFVPGVPFGRFAGADSVAVRLSQQGEISEIQLIYPVGYDLDGLSARLDSDYFVAERPAYLPSANWSTARRGSP